ncbi:LexA family protein [Ignatzschineria cameli]|uniref:Peptidase S24 n=1 Tax=Ignatzschineria cameli TaxID=2182793 RepID=A0A2U2AQC9_9GAMM|nr:XRE family transcriptional regulator [Ignatzschineria cameli]PWD85831.1 peptidase S24 [Ignatzschineria cameli]PWD89459.1 peptidase S24 [Ignatzschineria cameli]PWD90931.1 peptidase S24 [Ignatzschineria cameli]PWD91719.1 peptidase S24 [Ignatzschineria cameli]
MLKERLKEARKRMGISREKLAELAGVSTSTITFLENGRNDGSKFLVEIARVLGVTAEWLMYGIDSNTPTTAEVRPMPNTTPTTQTNEGSFVPVISWVTAGNFHSVETLPADELIKWVPCPVAHSENTFALRVVGVSMENPNGKPSFEDGDIIYVDPDRVPENKSLVVVTLEGSSSATFKQLVIETDGMYIQPLNPNWHEKVIKINGNAVINGVVIGKWTDV